MPWKVVKRPEAILELIGLLRGLGLRAPQAAIEHFDKLPGVDDTDRELGRIADLPFYWVYPAGDPRRDEFLIVRLQVPDAEFGQRELCVFLAFAYSRRVVGVLGCTWWDSDPNWLTHRVNGELDNPTFEEYLNTRKIGVGNRLVNGTKALSGTSGSRFSGLDGQIAAGRGKRR